MRLFKSRKSGEYSDVSSVVANENDPHVKIVSCNSQQEFQNDEKNIQNGNDDSQQIDIGENSTTNSYPDEQKKNYHAHNLKVNDINNCTDKFTPIPDCDQIDESANNHYEMSMHTDELTTTSSTKNQEIKLHSDSTSDFINELFGTVHSYFPFNTHCLSYYFFSLYFFFFVKRMCTILDILFTRKKRSVFMKKIECTAK